MKRSRRTFPNRPATIGLLLILLASLAPAASDAGQVSSSGPILYVPGPRPGGLGPVPELPNREQPRPLERARTWRALRDEAMVRQGWDYSCGSAALASLLSSPDEAVSEKEILLEALSGLSPEQEQRTMEEGLSLLDLRRVAQGRGYQAAGYRVGPEMLRELTRPVLVFIEPEGYRHFAVLRGLRGDRAFLADPARGNVRLPIWRFLEMWQDESGRGVVFIVGAKTPDALELATDVSVRPELAAVQRPLETGARRALPPVRP